MAHGAITGLRYGPRRHNGPPAHPAPCTPARYGCADHDKKEKKKGKEKEKGKKKKKKKNKNIAI